MMYAHAAANPPAQITLKALNTWKVFYGTPKIIDSDQGTHFTSTKVQSFATINNIDWHFHLTYNPTAAGIIERYHGLLKSKCNTLLVDNKYSDLQSLLNKATFALNNRPRTNRFTPIEELILPHITEADIKIGDLGHTKRIPYKIIVKSAKDSSLSQQEIIRNAGRNTIWTIDQKGHLQQIKLDNTTPN